MRTTLGCLVAWACLYGQASAASPVAGTYIEARTCQVYTGPCFANGEVGSTGKDAILAWHIDRGRSGDVELSGLTVAVIVKASETLGFNGFADARSKRATLLLDRAADESQQQALLELVLRHTGLTAEQLVNVELTEMHMSFATAALTAQLQVGQVARLHVRKARPNDCICSNESAYYPPLTPLMGSVPGVTIDGDVVARKLGTRWSIPDTRTAYLGTFQWDPSGDSQRLTAGLGLARRPAATIFSAVAHGGRPATGAGRSRLV